MGTITDYFDTRYNKEDPRSDRRYGLNDSVREDEGDMAYSTADGDECGWNAIVVNERMRRLLFVPVDHNIVARDNGGNEISQCDGMLYTTEENRYLAFVELKAVKTNWQTDAVAQLRSTINLYLGCGGRKKFAVQEACVCNRKHPCFHIPEFGLKEEFRSKGFRLLIGREIFVK